MSRKRDFEVEPLTPKGESDRQLNFPAPQDEQAVGSEELHELKQRESRDNVFSLPNVYLMRFWLIKPSVAWQPPHLGEGSPEQDPDA